MQSSTEPSSTAETRGRPDRIGRVGRFAEQGLKFIERCAGAGTQACVNDFLGTIRQMGFEGTACGAWAGVGKNRRHRFFFVAWPDDWLEFYNKNCGFEHDLLPIEARRRMVSYLWSELRAGRQTPEQAAFFNAGWMYGWREVVAVPIHGPASLQGLVTMATRKARALAPAECAILETMGRTIWERCRSSEGFGTADRDEVKLSPREVECLQWVATGKSDGDIAAILGISSATVHYHIEHAKRRLAVHTRVEAVAVGVLNGII